MGKIHKLWPSGGNYEDKSFLELAPGARKKRRPMLVGTYILIEP